MPPLHPWRITAASYRNDTSWRAINFAPRNIPVRSESADADKGRGTRRDEKREREKKRRCTPRCLIVTIALAATRRGSGGRGEGGGARCIYTVYPHYSRSFAKRQAAREGRALLGALARWHTIPHAFFSPPNPPQRKRRPSRALRYSSASPCRRWSLPSLTIRTDTTRCHRHCSFRLADDYAP